MAIGFLGLRQDSGKGPKRWNKWRPSVSLALQPDLEFSKYYLIHHPDDVELAERIERDVLEKKPELKVLRQEINFKDPWDFESVYGSLLSFSKTLKLDFEHEELLVHITTGTHVQQICMFLLTERGYLPGSLIQTVPLAGKESDPIGRHLVVDLNLDNYKSLRSGQVLDQMDNVSFLKSGIPTRNQAFNKMVSFMEKVALKSKEPMLLAGPTGAGKSLLANKIFELKKQRHLLKGSLVEINCGTLQGDATMSSLFGHVKGAFTGAISDRKGALSEADQGLLFLDEIGELGVDEQAMLLTAIETKTFRRMGSDKLVKSDFVLIAGTNKNLASEVRAGRFREDLLARINLWTFELPALKDRREDIEPNLDYELIKASERLSCKVTMTGPAKTKYLEYAMQERAVWNNNFRDLNSSILRMGTLADAGVIGVDDVELEWKRLMDQWYGSKEGMSQKNGQSKNSLRKYGVTTDMDVFEKITLEGTLNFIEQYKSMAEAGRHLYACSRKLKSKSNDADRLKKYLSKYSLSWSDIDHQ